MKFFEVESGLYLYRPPHQNNDTRGKISAYSFLTLVSANKSDFTAREVKKADVARALYRRIGFPGYKRYINAVRNGCIMNCPINIDDIKRSIHIYGPDVAGIKGKTTRRKPKALEMIGNIPLTPNTMVSSDYVYLHTLPHLHTISRG